MWLGAALLLPCAWLIVHFAHLAEAPAWVALSSGIGIFGAAFLLSWACEVAELDIPRALALAFLALVAVAPEYAVDVYFAWRAGQDPSYTAFATANMTGSNRLLIGVGWVAPVLIAALRRREAATTSGWLRREIVLPREQAVEVNYLALATAYSVVIPFKRTLSLVDTAILFVIFALYMRAAGRTHHEEPVLEGPAAMIAALGVVGRRLMAVGLFALAGLTILTAAEPFAESLIASGKEFGVEEFLLVQWVAPLASESPEFVVAILFAWRGAAAAGIGTMISSKVNQWTLLVGALPLAYALSHGSMEPMHLDDRQCEEILLTTAQSVFALLVIANFRFALWEALVLLGLFLPQFFFTSEFARHAEAIAYVVLSVAVLVASPATRSAALALFPRPRGRG